MKIKYVAIFFEPNNFKYVFRKDKFEIQFHRIRFTSACSVTNI